MPSPAATFLTMQIVATMQANNIQRIYTFNNADFQKFSELEVITP